MKKIFSLAVILALLVSVPAFSASNGGMLMSGPYKDGTKILFATGGEQGEYYAFGSAMADMVNGKTTTQVYVMPSSGSANNIEALSKKQTDLALIQSDAGFYATHGIKFFSKKHSNFATVAALYPEPIQIVTLNPKITHVEHLKGKTVSVGAEGSGTYFNAVDVLKAYDMDIYTDINPVYESFGNSVEALREGKIDAAFIVAGTPTPAVSELAGSKKISIVSLDDEHIMKLIVECPYYKKIEIPKSTYGTEDNDVTAAIDAVIVARDDVKANDIYNFMYGVFENVEEIAKVNPRAASLTLKTAANYPAIPYHPGAVKYFGEKGILVLGKKK